MHVFNPENEAFHGEKVGIATGLVLDEYRRVAAFSAEDFSYNETPYANEAMIRAVFGSLSEEILKENAADPLSGIREADLKEKWPEITALVKALPTGDDVRSLLKTVHGSIALSDIGLSEKMAETLFRYAPLVRNRLTLLRIRNQMKEKT